MALGTNKLQGSFRHPDRLPSTTSEKGQASLKESWIGIVFTLVGAALGAMVVQQLDPDFLETGHSGIAAAGIFLHPVFQKFGFQRNTLPKLSSRFLLYPVRPWTGIFMTGFFGPGTGSFWDHGLLWCCWGIT